MPQTQSDRCGQNGKVIVPGQKFSNRAPRLTSLRGAGGWVGWEHTAQKREESLSKHHIRALPSPEPSPTEQFSRFLLVSGKIYLDRMLCG